MENDRPPRKNKMLISRGYAGGGGGVGCIVTGQIEPRLNNESNLKVVRTDVLQSKPNEI